MSVAVHLPGWGHSDSAKSSVNKVSGVMFSGGGSKVKTRVYTPKKEWPPSGGLEPPTFWLEARRPTIGLTGHCIHVLEMWVVAL